MKTKLIKNTAKEYYLVVLHKNLPKWFNAAFELSNGYYAIASSTKIDGVGEFPLLSLKNCQAIELGYDLDELADKYYGPGDYGLEIKTGFIKGFEVAMRLMGDKKFSEDDVMLGWDAGVMSQSICFTNYFGLKRESELKSHRESYQGNLKPSALQQTEWDVEIEMQKVKDETKIVGAVKGVKGSGSKITTYKSVPKLDADGCLILKRVI